MAALFRNEFRLRDYDLDATLDCGQAFRWVRSGRSWEGVVGRRWVQVTATSRGLEALTTEEPGDWSWFERYFQTKLDLRQVVASFPPDDPSLSQAVSACWGLRLLRQEPWECLASFICSSTKQIVQIRQILQRLCCCFGDPLPVPPGSPPAYAFPSPGRIAACTEAELRACKMGFRAPYLLEAARRVACGSLPLEALETMAMEPAREALMSLPGVGRKIADCVLLFACGFQSAFPIDVWVQRALIRHYFPRRRRVPLPKLEKFSRVHFGPHSGLAQQYLFHHIRLQAASKAGRMRPHETDVGSGLVAG